MFRFDDGSRDQTKKMVHYIISHTQPSQLGATKLAKVMWCADVLHYRKHGETISRQSSYVRRDRGPMPNGMYEAIDSLKTESKIVEHAVPTYAGTRREFFHIEAADAGWFSSHEVETIMEAISQIAPLSAMDASERTHGPLWGELNNSEQMSVRAASVISGEVLESDIEWALENKAAFAD